MPAAARLTDSTMCAYTSAHCGHPKPKGGKEHPGGSTPGNISTGSPNVSTNGLPAARITDSTDETTSPYCTSGTGTVSAGSSTVFINGLKAARKGDLVVPHTDVNGKITSGSGNVTIGG